MHKQQPKPAGPCANSNCHKPPKISSRSLKWLTCPENFTGLSHGFGLQNTHKLTTTRITQSTTIWLGLTCPENFTGLSPGFGLQNTRTLTTTRITQTTIWLGLKIGKIVGMIHIICWSFLAISRVYIGNGGRLVYLIQLADMENKTF